MKRAGEPIESGRKKKRHANRKRSDTEKKEDKSIYDEITTNGERIEPDNIIKYAGCVYRMKGETRWVGRFSRQYSYIKQKICDTKEEAQAYIKRMNIKYELPVKNMIFLYENEYYCVLTQNKLMKFALKHLDIVDRYNWYASYSAVSNSYYAQTNAGDTILSFHRLVCPTDSTVDHISRDTLDNTPPNLRAASRSVQMINRNVQSSNTSGIVGVSYDKLNNSYRASWTIDKKWVSKAFSVGIHGKKEALEMAIALRKEKENTLNDYAIALSNK